MEAAAAGAPTSQKMSLAFLAGTGILEAKLERFTVAATGMTLPLLVDSRAQESIFRSPLWAGLISEAGLDFSDKARLNNALKKKGGEQAKRQRTE